MTRSGTLEPESAFVRLDGETFYRITDADRLAPFLMSIASDTDLWMFVASSGGLTAGRTDPDGSLFPYDNVDRLYDAHLHTGPITLIRCALGGEVVTWQPFSERAAEDFQVERRLYKNVPGNRVVFEEVNHDLGLAFRYRWSGCDTFGWVRTARLARIGAGPAEVAVLDGLRNVLPFGVPLALYQQQSSLVDAYKRNECDPETGLAIFSLTAKITDRAEAAEALRAAVVWVQGLEHPVVSVAGEALAAFRAGRPVEPAALRTGCRGHYFASATLWLEPGAHATWHVVADTGRGPADIVRLRERLRGSGIPGAEIEAALDAATAALTALVARADGLQCTAHPTGPAHHFANVLFNVMRGGVFAGGYAAPRADIVDFLRTRNRAVAARHAALLDALHDPAEVPALIESARRTGDPDFERLCLEYLPLSFGRRHGDPSRPWNRFSIRVRGEDGAPALYYEGNWRDVFQNWEALAASFPLYLPGMIARFVNASTVDGFNPYRITRDGVDWEVPNPDDPWSHIGYWGDHQIVYLLRLMEALHRYAPEALRDLLDRRVFAYANVPYRLKPYAAMRADPHATVDFDAARAAAIAERVHAVGTDGKLVAGAEGGVRHAPLVEKLLVTALARLSNFVPDGGIWMNTQRPEWNDANNALAGHGVSTVTLCYLRRYLAFFAGQIEARGTAPVTVADGVAAWAREVHAILDGHRPASDEARGPGERKAILDALGEAFGRYREHAYAGGGDGEASVPSAELLALCRSALAHVDHAIARNRRWDGLYHAYHVLGAADDHALPLEPLHEMLEGQVAALSSGAMPPAEAASLVEALFESPMYDPARRSFMLYPERELPAFLEKNVVPADRVRAIGLLRCMLETGDASIVAVDDSGTHRFHPDLAQAGVLGQRLDSLAAHPERADAVARDRRAVLDLYESVFRHRSFTGRSGTMYGYEGIGCIYWHMVAKLMLAVQEHLFRAADEGRPVAEVEALARAYGRIRRGLGYEKTPAEYGAFPTDPYSHTPRGAGARQPGMTGQVKEEILARWGELGVRVEGGAVRFRPVWLDRRELLTEPRTFRVLDVSGRPLDVDVPAGGLAFTFCQVPVVYHAGGRDAWIRITGCDGASVTEAGDALGPVVSRSLFERRGEVARIDVSLPARAELPALSN